MSASYPGTRRWISLLKRRSILPATLLVIAEGVVCEPFGSFRSSVTRRKYILIARSICRSITSSSRPGTLGVLAAVSVESIRSTATRKKHAAHFFPCSDLGMCCISANRIGQTLHTLGHSALESGNIIGQFCHLFGQIGQSVCHIVKVAAVDSTSLQGRSMSLKCGYHPNGYLAHFCLSNLISGNGCTLILIVIVTGVMDKICASSTHVPLVATFRSSLYHRR